MKRRFEQLVDDHGGRLLQLARMLLGRGGDAEDVVQESLIKLWDRLPEVESGAELPWLLTCTRNACIDVLRRRKRQRGLLDAAGGDPLIDEDDSQPLAPEAHVGARERAGRLRAAIAAMPEPGRSLLILRDLQEIEVAQVARALNLSENQVKVYTFRARRVLRRALEEECDAQVA